MLVWGPTPAQVWPKHMWYRRRDVVLRASATEGLTAALDDEEPSKQPPLLSVALDDVVSVTRVDATTLELRFGGQKNSAFACWEARVARGDALPWLGLAGGAGVLAVLPPALWDLVVAYLDVSGWRALRATCSRARELCRTQLGRIAARVSGAAWVPEPVPWTSAPTLRARVVLPRATSEEDLGHGMTTPHPLFPDLCVVECNVLVERDGDGPAAPLVATAASLPHSSVFLPLVRRVACPPVSFGAQGLRIALDPPEVAAYDVLRFDVRCDVAHPRCYVVVFPQAVFDELVANHGDAEGLCWVDPASTPPVFKSEPLVLADRSVSGFVSAAFSPGLYRVAFMWAPEWRQNKTFVKSTLHTLHVPTAVELRVTPPPWWSVVRIRSVERVRTNSLHFCLTLEADPADVTTDLWMLHVDVLPEEGVRRPVLVRRCSPSNEPGTVVFAAPWVSASDLELPVDARIEAVLGRSTPAVVIQVPPHLLAKPPTEGATTE